jgi:hypothetical protein
MLIPKGVFIGSRNSVYPAISRNDNHGSKATPRPARHGRESTFAEHDRDWEVATQPKRAVIADQDNRLRAFWEIGIPGRWWHRIGTRASANTSGPDFTSSFENPLGVLEPVKLRTAGIHTERRKPVFFCRTGFRASELFRNNDPAV